MKRFRARAVPVTLLVAALAVAAGAGAWLWHAGQPRTAQQADIETLGLYGQVPDFTLVERSGRTVTLADLRGRVWVANFIYTECTETCPTQSLQLSSLQAEFAKEPDLRLVSITVDPEHDTPEALARYAERYRVDPERWLFLTGSRRVIYALAKEGFKLGVVDPGDPQGASSLLRLVGPRAAYATHGSKGLVMHSSRLVVVDRQARVRAYHGIDEPGSLARLRENLRALLAER
jgi:protein SCO1/2